MGKFSFDAWKTGAINAIDWHGKCFSIAWRG